jgi:hypothetical protein
MLRRTSQVRLQSVIEVFARIQSSRSCWWSFVNGHYGSVTGTAALQHSIVAIIRPTSKSVSITTIPS